MAGVTMNLSSKITHREAIANCHAILKAIGSAESTDRDLTIEELTSLYDQHRLLDFKNPRKPRVSKVSSNSMERSSAPYNPCLCDARVWLKGGLDGQCSRQKNPEGGYFCKIHVKDADSHDGKTRHGLFTDERPTHIYGDESLELCGWPDQEKVKKSSKKPSSSKSSGKQLRKCGFCNTIGHNARTCPEKKKQDDPEYICKPCEVPEPVVDSVDSVDEQYQEPEPEVVSVVDSVVDSVVEQYNVPEPEPEPEPVAEPEPEPEPEPSPGQPLLREDMVLSDEDEDDETIDCDFEGVSYFYDKEMVVFDEDHDPVGTWDGSKIVFDKQGLKCHKMKRDV